jgi:hypothetical protein
VTLNVDTKRFPVGLNIVSPEPWQHGGEPIEIGDFTPGIGAATMRAAQAQAASGETLPQRLRDSYHRIIGEHHLDVPQLLKAANEIEHLWDDVAKLLTRCLLLDEEVAHQRKVIHAAARDLYVAEIHRQGVGWDDYCTDLLVRSQHALAAETKP